ncbi:LAFA_0G07800g1_1 [Lachancea sp. 'fantastica']|nr:LAFA_0G07800g1_1 [Lachancea sp. 'fantastica']
MYGSSIHESDQTSWNVKLQRLEAWLNGGQGFYISDNVVLQDIQESGRGLYLKDGKISKNDVVVTIPSEYQLNFHTVVYHISQFNRNLVFEGITCEPHLDSKKNGATDDPRFEMYESLNNEKVLQLSSFQLLSLYILLEWKILPSYFSIESFWKPFFDVFPTPEELSSIPALWELSIASKNKPLFDCLPWASKSHAERIVALVRNDWSVIEPLVKQWCNKIERDSGISLTSRDFYSDFLHIYFVINSRCLYMHVPLKDSIADNFTLVPYVDFLNHDADSELYCTPKVDKLKRGKCGLGTFSIIGGSHQYKQSGEQILLSYGAHSNDFLLNEYGFVLPTNKWNYMDVSPHCESMISGKSLQDFLKKHEFWGDYTISEGDISYRLLVAFASKVCPDLRKVEKLMLGYLTEASFDPALTELIQEFLQTLHEEVKTQISVIQSLTDTDPVCPKNVLSIYHGYELILQNHRAGESQES